MKREIDILEDCVIAWAHNKSRSGEEFTLSDLALLERLERELPVLFPGVVEQFVGAES